MSNHRKQLLVMRHAKSSWEDEMLSDHDRPLNPRGLRDAPRMGTWLIEHDQVPDRIFSSTANRALTTARMVAETLPNEPVLIEERRLYHAHREDYQEVIACYADDASRLLVVSHNPGSEEWINFLTGEFVVMPTAAVAVISFSEDFRWTKIYQRKCGQLVDVWRPKEIDRKRAWE